MIRKRNEQLAKTVIKGLQSRNMSGYYAEDKEAALKQALELIPEGSTIAMGGCMSAGEIGLISALEAGNYHYIDRSKMDARAGLMAAYDADIFLSSANAITSDGVMVNIDGNSNRVSCIAQGPRKVIFIVGINKVCADLDSAMKRARNVAAPINAQRFDIKTPCKETGKCFDCKSPDTICCQFLITRYSRHTDRRNCRKGRTRQTSIMSLGRKKSRRILKGFSRVRNLKIREFLLLRPLLLLHPLRLPPSLKTITSGFLMGKSLRSGGRCIMMGRSRCAPTAIR